MANLTDAEDRELKRKDLRHSDIRRDFSVIHSKQMKKNHLFLGPARFVNHDCNNNCELFREGRYITFRVLRPISIGDEITAHYGDGYFGRKNRHCLCETCEKTGKGGYAPVRSEDDVHSDSDSDSDSASGTSSSASEELVQQMIKKPDPKINERRTRRGVYAILREEDDDSDESDDEETNTPLIDVPVGGEVELEAEAETSSELTPIPSSRSSSNSALSPDWMTPDPDSLPVLSSSLDSLSSNTSGARGNMSTRRQKVAVTIDGDIPTTSRAVGRVQQLVTPPLSEDTASLIDTSGSSTRRVTSSRTTANEGKGKNKVSTPSPSKGKGKREEKTKIQGRSEVRVLRTRPSCQTPDTKALVARPEKPRGSDGKLLPTCVTCSNVLPVISVDRQIVWGVIETSPRGKGKKMEKQECPRCIRHFAIYAQLWPSRIPAHGTAFLPTPREESAPAETVARRVSQKTLPALDQKLAAAASAWSKTRHHQTIGGEGSSKRKAETGPRVDMSAKAKEVLLGRRHSYPSTKTQATDLPKRKRGRPRLSSPVSKPELPTGDKSLRLKSLAVQNQPRDSNGRFGKKGASNGRFTRKRFTATVIASSSVASRAQRALERGKIKSWLEQKEESEMENPEDQISSHEVTRKRNGDDLEESPSKKARYNLDEEAKQASRFVFPPERPAFFHFRGIGLFGTPNPMSFARRTWGTKTEIREATNDGMDKDRKTESPLTSGDESDPPVTPDDHTPSLAIARSEEDRERTKNGDSGKLKPPAPHPLVALTFKPSPFNFARRRWVSMAASPDGSSLPRLAGNTSLPDPADGSRAVDPESLFETGSLGQAGFSISAPPKADGVYASSWLDEESSDEDVIVPESPKSSMFVLQHRASFSSKSPPTRNVDDSNRTGPLAPATSGPSLKDSSDGSEDSSDSSEDCGAV